MAGRWARVADGISVTTSRRELTTSTVITDAGQALLIDPAWDPDELEWIADDLLSSGVHVVAGFATHAHHDHLLWHPGLGLAPRWASPRTADIADHGRGQLVEQLGADHPPALTGLMGRVAGLASGTAPWPGRTVKLVTHDAHIQGHTALWVPASRTLIAGDMLSDVEPPLPEETGLGEYLAGLETLLPYVRRAATVIPGHGHVADGAEGMRRWTSDHRFVLDRLPAT